MKFDKSKVYTALNADDVKVGSRGYFSDSLAFLKEYVQKESKCAFGKIEDIFGESCVYRFSAEGDLDSDKYAMFYLVEEPEEKKFRPYRDTVEMIEDFKKRFNTNVPSYGMPLIWIQREETCIDLIDTFYPKEIAVRGGWHDLSDLLDNYTYLDGSPCGMEIAGDSDE